MLIEHSGTCNIEKVGGPGGEASLVLDSTQFSISEAAGCGPRDEDTSVNQIEACDQFLIT